jgi:hypothetical protein
MKTLEKRSSESTLYDLDCSILLAVGETIISVTTFTAEPITTPPIVVGAASINSSAVTYTDAFGSTRVAPIGQVIQVNISGGAIPTSALIQDYILRAKFLTSRNPAVEATVRMRLNDTPSL